MPSADVGLAESLIYFGSGLPPVTDAKAAQLPHTFRRSFLIAQQHSSGTEYNQAISTMIGRILHEDERYLSSDERFVRSALGGHGDLLSDISLLRDLGAKREDKVEMAIINQSMATDFFRIQTRAVPLSNRQGAEFIVTAMQSLADHNIEFGKRAMVALNGARAQAVTMNTLHEAGYEIVVPDVKQPEEVGRWDVDAGVDFVASRVDESTGQVALHLIDAKGRLFIEDTTEKVANVGIQVVRAETETKNAVAAQRDILVDVTKLLVGKGKVPAESFQKARIIKQRIETPTDNAFLRPDGSFKQEFLTKQLLSGIKKYW